MNEDLYKNVLVLTIKNGNIVLLPYTGEYDKETTLSSKNEYDSFNSSNDEDYKYLNNNIYICNWLNCNNQNNGNRNLLLFTSKLNNNWKNNIKTIKINQLNEYKKKLKVYY